MKENENAYLTRKINECNEKKNLYWETLKELNEDGTQKHSENLGLVLFYANAALGFEKRLAKCAGVNQEK